MFVMMMIFIMTAYISGPALLFAQTAIASIDEQGGSSTTAATNNTDTTTTTTAPDNAARRVAVGGGNISISINQFSPQTTEIQPGESVTFFAPSGSTEVHNVIFDLSNGTIISDVGVPFTLPSDNIGEVPTEVSEALLPAPPYNLGEPIIQSTANGTSDGTQAMIGFNKIAFYPAVVDQNGNVRYLDEEELSSQMLQIGEALAQGTPMPTSLSANYTMDGTETIVSSGIVLDVNGLTALEGVFLDEGGASQAAGDNQETINNSTTTAQQEENGTEGPEPTPGEVFPPATEEPQSTSSQVFPPAQFPYLGSFTVKFNEPGTYDYFCAFHPGMFGQVIVGSRGEEETNQTSTVTPP